MITAGNSEPPEHVPPGIRFAVPLLVALLESDFAEDQIPASRFHVMEPERPEPEAERERHQAPILCSVRACEKSRASSSA